MNKRTCTGAGNASGKTRTNSRSEDSFCVLKNLSPQANAAVRSSDRLHRQARQGAPTSRAPSFRSNADLALDRHGHFSSGNIRPSVEHRNQHHRAHNRHHRDTPLGTSLPCIHHGHILDRGNDPRARPPLPWNNCRVPEPSRSDQRPLHSTAHPGLFQIASRIGDQHRPSTAKCRLHHYYWSAVGDGASKSIPENSGEDFLDTSIATVFVHIPSDCPHNCDP
jgi:hypothetical protein